MMRPGRVTRFKHAVACTATYRGGSRSWRWQIGAGQEAVYRRNTPDGAYVFEIGDIVCVVPAGQFGD